MNQSSVCRDLHIIWTLDLAIITHSGITLPSARCMTSLHPTGTSVHLPMCYRTLCPSYMDSLGQGCPSLLLICTISSTMWLWSLWTTVIKLIVLILTLATKIEIYLTCIHCNGQTWEASSFSAEVDHHVFKSFSSSSISSIITLITMYFISAVM